MNHSGQVIGTGAALGYASGNYAGDAAKVCEQRAAEIPQELDRLERTLKGCDQGLDTLAVKLESSVMRSQPPQPCATANAPSAVPQTPYGSRLQELVTFAAILNERIQSINARLEV
jgi:hypothetical protein